MEEARSIAERYFQAVGAGDVESAVALFAKDADFTAPTGKLPSPEGIRAMLRGYAEAFPENRFEIARAVVSSGDVVVEGFWHGRHTGTMRTPDGKGIPPTGKSVRIPFATLFSVREGKIVSHHGYWDMAGFLAQLGLGG